MRYLPSLEEIDIVELVKFHRELEGGLQIAHVWSVGARARAARGAIPAASRGALTEARASWGAFLTHIGPPAPSHDHTRKHVASQR